MKNPAAKGYRRFSSTKRSRQLIPKKAASLQ